MKGGGGGYERRGRVEKAEKVEKTASQSHRWSDGAATRGTRHTVRREQGTYFATLFSTRATSLAASCCDPMVCVYYSKCSSMKRRFDASRDADADVEKGDR